MARVRMGAMAVGFAIQRELGLESLIHFTTRDRNLMALESELLGAHALGVRDILALTGDPPRIGDYPGGTGIWDIDSTGLIGILTPPEPRRGPGRPAHRCTSWLHHRLCPRPDREPTWSGELDRLAGKIEAGAHVIMTQPIYAAGQWQRFMDRASARWGDRLPRARVAWACCPCTPSRHAEFLHNEVPGITIPDDVRAAMLAAGDRGAEIGLETSLALLRQMRPFVEGTYVMPSFGRYEQSAELVRRVRAEHGQPAERHVWGRSGMMPSRQRSATRSGRLLERGDAAAAAAVQPLAPSAGRPSSPSRTAIQASTSSTGAGLTR